MQSCQGLRVYTLGNWLEGDKTIRVCAPRATCERGVKQPRSLFYPKRCGVKQAGPRGPVVLDAHAGDGVLVTIAGRVAMTFPGLLLSILLSCTA